MTKEEVAQVVAYCEENKISYKQRLEELGINPYFVKDYEMAAKRFPAGKTFLIVGYLRDTDARLKGINNPSAKDADLWKELLYKILH